MNRNMRWWALLIILLLPFSSGCENTSTSETVAADAGSGSSADDAESFVFFNITTDGTDDPQRLDMALKLAGFSLDEGRNVVLFFNVKGVHVPATTFADDFAFADEPPIKEQLNELIERGADAHVCPVCMNALGVSEGDIIEGAQVTTRPKLFATIGPNTAVFSY